MQADSGALAARPLAWLGVLSYAVYLVHYPLLRMARPICEMITARLPAGLGSPVAFAIELAFVVACAALLHRLVEVPARRFVRSLASDRHLRPARSLAPAAEEG